MSHFEDWIARDPITAYLVMVVLEFALLGLFLGALVLTGVLK